jgi:hypothetical protein
MPTRAVTHAENHSHQRSEWLFLIAATGLLGTVLAIAVTVALGGGPNPARHLRIFNILAVVIVTLDAVALGTGLAGLWSSRLRDIRFVLVEVMAVAVLLRLLIDP